MKTVTMTCDAVELTFTVTVDGGEIYIEDVDFADKESVMSEPDFLDKLDDELRDEPLRVQYIRKRVAKFENVYCSQCGKEFGPGNHGYSHCKDHK